MTESFKNWLTENVAEMNDLLDRTERLAKRGLITDSEAESRMIDIIDNKLPYYDKRRQYNLDEYEEVLNQRRLARRRMWMFMLKITEDKVVF